MLEWVAEGLCLRVLVVEDDEMLGDAVCDHLAAEGHAVDWARGIVEAGDFLRVAPYQLVVLDLQLPDGAGDALLRKLRDSGDAIPVIIVTARDQLSDRLEGLNSGADDYLVKPFALAELSARIAAVLRRYSGQPSSRLCFGDFCVDRNARTVSVAGKELELTSREWAILDQFVAHPSSILEKRQLEDAIYEFGAEIESNTIEVYISRLRAKIGKERIKTIRGLGYRWTAR